MWEGTCPAFSCNTVPPPPPPHKENTKEMNPRRLPPSMVELTPERIWGKLARQFAISCGHKLPGQTKEQPHVMYRIVHELFKENKDVLGDVSNLAIAIFQSQGIFWDCAAAANCWNQSNCKAHPMRKFCQSKENMRGFCSCRQCIRQPSAAQPIFGVDKFSCGRQDSEDPRLEKETKVVVDPSARHFALSVGPLRKSQSP